MDIKLFVFKKVAADMHGGLVAVKVVVLQLDVQEVKAF